MVYTNKPYNSEEFMDMFQFTVMIVSHRRPWYMNLRRKFSIHPAVYDAMKLCRPYDWQQLLLEYPYRSETDPTRLAYTRDERAGVADKQTITTIGKYLMRHFPRLHDHTIRDIVALYTTPSTFKILDSVEQFIHAVNNGPNSCMCWREQRGVMCSDGVRRHPYACYDPAFGWRMAVRLEGERIDGRALLMHEDDGEGGGNKYYVRSFKRTDGYSYSDEALEAWLKSQGYHHYSGWHGAHLAYIAVDGSFLAPYIDGDAQSVDVTRKDGEHMLVISDSGEYECDNTDGTPSGANTEYCESCGDYFDPDSMSWVGYNDEVHVCDNCQSEYYVYGYGRNGRQYYFHQDQAVYVDSQSEYYHEDWLNDNEIVQTYDGEYEHIDDCVFVDTHGDYYHSDDDRVVYDHEGNYQLIAECEQLESGEWALEHTTFVCASSNKRYLIEDVPPVEVDGELYHPDNVPEAEETETNTETGE